MADEEKVYHERREFIDPDLSVGSALYSVVRLRQWGEYGTAEARPRIDADLDVRDSERSISWYFGGSSPEKLKKQLEKAEALEQHITLFVIRLRRAISEFPKGEGSDG